MRSKLIVAAVAVLAAGCGTTVTGVPTAATGVGDALGVQPSAAPGSSLAPGQIAGGAGGGTTSLPPGAVAGGGGGGAAAAGQPGTSQPGGQTNAPGVTPVVPGLGITATKIYVGVTYSTGSDQANRALGNNITTGDQKADAQAVIDDINAHGGVAGRKLTPVWYDYQQTDARPYTTIDGEACATFTQDNHVFAVAGGGITDNFDACIQKAGALEVSSASSIIGPDNAFFQRFPYLFSVGYLTQERMMAAEVRSLVRQNYFSGWNSATGTASSATPAKIGIISFDTPKWNTPLDHVLLPALKAAGHPVDPADVQRVTYPSDNSQVASSVADIQSAVLKFRQDGVTHVIDLDGNGSMTLHMLNNMRGQHYYPRLGVNSASGVEVLYQNYAEDKSSFNGAVGLGWDPTLDLPAGAGDHYFTSNTQTCIKMIEQRTGQHFTDTNAAAVALGECDQLYLLADAINKVAGLPNRNTVAAAIEGLGGRFPAAGTRGLYFSRTQHDGVEYGYDMRFDDACSCVKYTGNAYVIP